MFNPREQEHILNTHIDQLKEWYAQAERVTKTNLPNDGDSIIYPVGGGWRVEEATFGWTEDIVNPQEEVRILARAPKPKPVWRDARAIIAHTDENPQPSVWTWHKSMERWDDEGGCHWANTEDLRDVTPLIEAKVTDEMAERAREEFFGGDVGGPVSGPSSARRWRAALTAALGLETA